MSDLNAEQLLLEEMSIADVGKEADIIIEENATTTTNALNKNSVSQTERAKERRR